MSNLGDGVPFLKSFDFISRGTYGDDFKTTDSYGVQLPGRSSPKSVHSTA